MKRSINSLSLAAAVLLQIAPLQAAPLACQEFEVGFSPEGSAEKLILKTIDSARSDVKILAYSFTAKEVVRALTQARKRNIPVSLVVDASNLTSRHSVAALSALVNAGASVRTIDRFKIAHDKVVIVDGKHVEFGSYNFSAAAATANSENANVCWNAPAIAATYTAHWKSRWDLGKTFNVAY